MIDVSSANDMQVESDIVPLTDYQNSCIYDLVARGREMFRDSNPYFSTAPYERFTYSVKIGQI